MENLLSTILEALAEPAVSYIGLGYDKTIGIRAGRRIPTAVSLGYLCCIDCKQSMECCFICSTVQL